MKHTYVVGTFVASMTGMKADYCSDPYDVIEAKSTKEACGSTLTNSSFNVCPSETK